jgi:putative addiction module component (TIGR02574 family)
MEPAMSHTAESLSQQAAQLPPAERMELVERILDTLDMPDPNLDALWAKEAEDRLAAYRRGEISALPLAEVLGKYTVKPAGR